ncbi:glycerol-3-phosphate 1-O-acyltransferase PlsB [Neptunicella marina]|uniref:Glycerol-3-phosphate acyltransferase n=1 Tax=Neptunicella marina TaxID=2125989 RepID=A0A8J6IU67_9ALTE|nr:glycerol-3-phosphate 1-O-acyltransferase PlsB [Neptunicella marina]MBC3765915.1 glycerol-3-phosphate 1-O-acyltransferase PlsB [Neptunicella marina]
MTWLQKGLSAIISIPAKWFIKTKVVPTDIQSELGLDPARPIIYLLKNQSLSDRLALSKAAKKLGLPAPSGSITIANENIDSCLFLEGPMPLFGSKPGRSDIDKQVTRIFQAHHQDPNLDIQIVPVACFWGRAPGKTEASWRDILISKSSPNWLRKAFMVMFLGRDNLVYFSKAVSSAYMSSEHGTDCEIAHKLIRVARAHFQRRKQAVVGPRQMAREQIIQSVLASAAVQEAIAEEKQSKKLSHDKAMVRAKSYADEIAGDYKEGLIRIAEKLLTRLWNKVYNGLEIHHSDKIRQLAQSGHEIIYVPCHRSHMDYLLLTYVIYHQGLMIPHIAAGINLNFWPAGPIFRRAGAFFIRRSFAGNKLYTAIFREYLEQLFNRGYSVKYYPEGGRSRTGRLLPPKTGMLAMTVQSLFKNSKRPISLVPVYIGYEHVMEVASYLNELRGSQKKKESFWQVFSALRKLKNYGIGCLNFGDPINLTQFIDQHQTGWRNDIEENPDKKPTWLTPVVNQLATQVMQRVNQAAAINGMNLASTCLLASEQHALTRNELQFCMDGFLQLFKQAPYSRLMTLPAIQGKKLVDHILSLNKFDVRNDNFGQVISLNEPSAIAMTYYRNNTIHLFMLPGLIAAMVLGEKSLAKADIERRMALIFPLLKRELFLHMDWQQMLGLMQDMLQAMLENNLLQNNEGQFEAAERGSDAYFLLSILNNVAQPTIQRYAIILTLLDDESGLSRQSLEKQSIKLAEHLSRLHKVTAPEFYDKNIIASLVQSLRESKLATIDSSGVLHRSEQSNWLLGCFNHWLAADIAKSIRQP